jgi:hypothetical protein
MSPDDGPDAWSVRKTTDLPDEARVAQAHEAAEQAVREADEEIIRGEIDWLADDIREWERRPPAWISGTTLTR